MAITVRKRKSGRRLLAATVPPVLGVRAEQRGEHHHLVLAGGDLGHRQNLVLGLRVADVQHGGGAGLILPQRARRAVAHLHGEVGRQLAFDVLRRHLEVGKPERSSGGRSVICPVNRVVCFCDQGLAITCVSGSQNTTDSNLCAAD